MSDITRKIPISQVSVSITAQLEQIHKRYGKILAAARTSYGQAVSIGGLLVNIKSKLPHGQWMSWASEKLPFSLSTAERWIELFDNRNNCKFVNVTNLTEAYKLLAGPVLDVETDVLSPTPDAAEQARLEELCAAVREVDEMPLPHGPEGIPIIEQWLAAVWNLLDWLLLPGVYEKFGGANRDELEQFRADRAEAEAEGAQ